MAAAQPPTPPNQAHLPLPNRARVPPALSLPHPGGYAASLEASTGLRGLSVIIRISPLS